MKKRIIYHPVKIVENVPVFEDGCAPDFEDLPADEPFITFSFNASWSEGVRYMVHCADGGAHDRATFWGAFATIDEAITCTKQGPAWRRPRAIDV